MKELHFVTAFACGVLLVAATASAQQPAMPAGMTHEEHMAQMKKDAELKQHGNLAMGFDQDKTTHHFTLTPEGGSIAVDANDPADQASRDQIRAHLKEIAAAFAQGDFGKPLETHGELPTGVPTMQRLRADLAYVYQDTPMGGIVRISTANEEALAAVHEFLAYQITEHKTGDSVTPVAQSRPEATPAAIEQADKAFAAAMVKADLTALASTYGDDYLFIDPTGRVSHKADLLDSFRRGIIKISSQEISDVRVNVYGNVAVETGTLVSHATRDGRDSSGTFRFTRVWVDRAGHWQSVAFQETRIATQP